MRVLINITGKNHVSRNGEAESERVRAMVEALGPCIV